MQFMASEIQAQSILTLQKLESVKTFTYFLSPSSKPRSAKLSKENYMRGRLLLGSLKSYNGTDFPNHAYSWWIQLTVLTYMIFSQCFFLACLIMLYVYLKMHASSHN